MVTMTAVDPETIRLLRKNTGKALCRSTKSKVFEARPRRPETNALRIEEVVPA